MFALIDLLSIFSQTFTGENTSIELMLKNFTVKALIISSVVN